MPAAAVDVSFSCSASTGRLTRRRITAVAAVTATRTSPTSGAISASAEVKVSTVTGTSAAAAALQPELAVVSATSHIASAIRSGCSSMSGPARSTSPTPSPTTYAAPVYENLIQH
ncbi:hypothetical protein [Streptomyces sp. WAC08241]|uniref:hypothetical protein n=1 Tax=Streptomyces sp. WAC08241 TaxID=2487421 RepID=UPI000F776223|nr:hypothetical protein [Streptomyces sp. WAC08241]RSS39047.1 hypothetical protein EF906_19660 [Streptomyces sp. WAC08241]